MVLNITSASCDAVCLGVIMLLGMPAASYRGMSMVEARPVALFLSTSLPSLNNAAERASSSLDASNLEVHGSYLHNVARALTFNVWPSGTPNCHIQQIHIDPRCACDANIALIGLMRPTYRLHSVQECLLLCGVSEDRCIDFSFVLWLFGGCVVGLLVVLVVPLLLSFLAMPGLCRFLRITLGTGSLYRLQI